ncbi:MAG: hypothetical protein ABIK09_15335 [Pseudomonadota bacterium]
MVSFPDLEPDPKSNSIDLAFSDGGGVIHDIVYTGDAIFLLARVNDAADFFVHRGNPSGGAWSQVGAAINETPVGMWTDGTTVYLMVNRINVPPGLACRQLPAGAGPAEPWQPCPGFPDYSKVGDNPFSFRGGLFGDSGTLAAWFEVQGTGKPSVAIHSATAGGAWAEIGILALPMPIAADFDGHRLWLGYKGDETDSLLYAADVGGTFDVVGTEGLPAPVDEAMDGILGICATADGTYLLHGAWNSAPGALYQLSVFKDRSAPSAP